MPSGTWIGLPGLGPPSPPVRYTYFGSRSRRILIAWTFPLRSRTGMSRPVDVPCSVGAEATFDEAGNRQQLSAYLLMDRRGGSTTIDVAETTIAAAIDLRIRKSAASKLLAVVVTQGKLCQ